MLLVFEEICWMPELARNYEERYYNSNWQYAQSNLRPVRQSHVRKAESSSHHNPYRVVTNDKKIKRNNFIARAVSLTLMMAIGFGVLPIGFKNISGSMFTKSRYPHIKTDYNRLVFPTQNYLHNHLFLGELSLNGAETKKPAMLTLPEGEELTSLESQIKNIMPMFPTIHPSVFVWDYETGNYADVNGEETFSAASIIKIPVLLQLFRSIEQKQVSLYDEMTLTEYYRSEGSGDLQFRAANSRYSLDLLARIMITHSDNSATNMIMSKIGSMTDVNQGIRDWGLSGTQVNNWLPDLAGTNYTTARDLARMLYNIENPKFLSVESREKIFDYMGHVRNNRLIQAGLGSGASFLHKTGDIGKMLGDAGIVYAPNGKKYIVVILANRPYNSPAGKEFIVKASEIIYNYMVR